MSTTESTSGSQSSRSCVSSEHADQAVDFSRSFLSSIDQGFSPDPILPQEVRFRGIWRVLVVGISFAILMSWRTRY